MQRRVRLLKSSPLTHKKSAAVKPDKPETTVIAATYILALTNEKQNCSVMLPDLISSNS